MSVECGLTPAWIAVVNLHWDMQGFFVNQQYLDPGCPLFLAEYPTILWDKNTKTKDLQGPGSCTSSVATVPRLSQ